jgi:hypothetical protein
VSRRILMLPPRSLTDAVIARCGFTRQMYRLVVFIHEWALCEAEAGEPVGIERFAAWWHDSPRTAYNRLEEFRQAFDLEKPATPSSIIEWPDGYPTRDAIESDRVRWELVTA